MPKKELSVQIAKKIAKEYLKKINDIESKDYHKTHEKSVALCAKIIAKNRKVNLEKLEIACWLHDIGRSISVENHAEQSIKILESQNYKVDKIIKDCILNGGRSGNPTTTEGKIFQIADKLSAISPWLLKILAKHSFNKEENERKTDFERIIKIVTTGINSLNSFISDSNK